MERRNWILLLILAALWGASYLFIKIGLDDLTPAGVVFTRTALAALVLMPFAVRSVQSVKHGRLEFDKSDGGVTFALPLGGADVILLRP